jgi:hypothetical protein
MLSSEPEGVASVCVACLRLEATKHDPLASRTAVTIVRNKPFIGRITGAGTHTASIEAGDSAPNRQDIPVGVDQCK